MITEIGRRPSAPQVGLTAAAAEEATDPGHHVVPVRGRGEQDGSVEEATRSTQIGHRDIIGIERPPAAGEREGGIERGVMEQIAPQHRVAHGDVALPAGGQVLADGHDTTVTTVVAGRSHADRTASHDRRPAPEPRPRPPLAL